MILQREERRKRLAKHQIVAMMKGRRSRQFPFKALLFLTAYATAKGDMMAKGSALKRGPGPGRRRLRPNFIQYPRHPNIQAFSTMVLRRELCD